MIKKILCFNLERELIFKKVYDSTFEDKYIEDQVLSNQDVNFIDDIDTIVYKRFDTLYVCFVTHNENEMYILNLLVFMMSLMDRLLGSLNEKSFIYNFKDINYLLDNFILNGKVINLDSLDIMSSLNILE